MQYLRRHWYDLGVIPAALIIVFLLTGTIGSEKLSFLMWVGFVSLLLHQFEEYRFPGYFPGMINSAMFGSRSPERYPLNALSALIVNAVLGWPVYFLAALFAGELLWLGLAVMIASFVNVAAHTVIMNLKAKTLYNPGMFTSLLLFFPLTLYYFYFISSNNIAGTIDYIYGTALGILFIPAVMFAVIHRLKDEDSEYVFEKRQLRAGRNQISV